MFELEDQGYFKSVDEFQFDLNILNQGLLGIGQYGIIRLALHKGTNRVYAVKTNDINKLTDEGELKLIKREIAIHSQLDHPHIVKLWSAFFEQEKIFMILEYAENRSMQEYMAEKEGLAEAEAFKYFYQTVKAVEYLHQCDVLHRDLKVQNLLLDQNLNVKLCDFGWSTTQLTLNRNTICGTFQHMAPQMINNIGYDYKIDIWGLGLILYQMIHGCLPFIGKSEQQVKKKMMCSIKYNKNIDLDLKNLLQKLLAIQASRRPSLTQIFQHQWIMKMKSSINSKLKKQTELNPTHLNQKINKLIQPMHKKTESTNLKRQSNGNININFMINNYPVKKAFQKTSVDHLKAKMTSAYKTMTQSSKDDALKFDKVNVFADSMKYPQYSKMLSKIKSSQDFNLKQMLHSTSKKITRRKSQEIISPAHQYRTEAIRTVTQTNQKKRTSKKKKTFDDLSSLLKKVGSGDLFTRKQKFI